MFRRTRLSASLAAVFGSGLLIASGTALAQTTVQRVEVTGSSIKRSDAETALPVTTLTRADIERSGATTAQDLVNMLPSNFGGLVTANNVGSTGNAATANLRSLGSKYTLVLLNGRRVANYAFGNSPVDLNSIPLSAVERIEVLRDGASAIYGADAVAGVINFILRKDYEGVEVSGYSTHTEQGGGNSTVANISGGFGNLSAQGFNIFFSANHEEDEALKAKDRSFGGSAFRPDLGINKASPRNGIPNLNFTDTKGNGYGSFGNQALVNPFRYNGCNNDAFALVVVDSTTCGTDYVKYIDLIPKQTHDNLLARGVVALGNDNQLYAEAVHVKDSMVSTYSPAPYTKTMIYPANGRFYPASITLPKGMTIKATPAAPYIMPDGTALTANTVLAADLVVTPTGPIKGTWRTVAGGGRTDLTDGTTDRVLVGAKGTIADWDYDTAFTTSKNDGTISFGPGKFSYVKLTPLVSAGEINVFGPQDATSLAKLLGAQITGPEQSATSKSTEFDFKVSKDLFQLPAGPLGLAFGASFRKEDLAQTSYPVLASGDEVGGSGPIPSVTGDRKVSGFFAESAIPIVKGLDLQLAARYDDYKNGFGTSFNNLSPKASLQFRPMADVLLRGSYGQGYRAPTLYENLRPLTTGNNTNANWSDPIRCPNGVPLATSATPSATTTINAVDSSTECAVQLPTALEGNKTLKPEKSEQYSLGIVFSPTANFSATVDYWNVNIKGAIAQKSEIQVMNDPVKYKDFIYRYDPVADPDQLHPIAGNTNKDFPIAYIYLPYDNTARFFAAGIDLNLQYKLKLADVGVLGLNLDGTYYTKHGYQYFGETSVSDLGNYQDFGPVPRWRHAATATLATGPWNLSLTNNLSTGYQDYTNLGAIGPNYPAVRPVAAYSTWDFQTGWKGIKNLDIVAGVKNLFNVDPPSSRTEVNFQTGFDAQFTDPHGRTYYLRARYKFF